MEKIEGWNELEAKGMNDYQGLPAGGYECIIKTVEDYTGMTSGKRSLKITLDIAKGDYKGFFQKQFDNDTRMPKKYSNNAVKYIQQNFQLAASC